MITVRLSGGLGNQMFEYAAAKALALKKNTKVRLDLTTLNHRLPGRGYVFRTYDLDLLNVNAEMTSLTEFSRYAKNSAYVFSRIGAKIRSKVNPKSIFKEKEYYLFDENIFSLPDDAYLDGFWQSRRYFEHCEDAIREEFSFRHPLSEKGKGLADKILHCQSVCINVRRGDYVSMKSNADFFGVLPLEYFQQGIELVKQKVSDPHFFIFTDDLRWCKENFNLPENTFFVTQEYSGERYIEKFHLMTLCRHFIIPNSTFGWWAAWLSDNPGKIVIAPKQWITDPKLNANTKDLISEGWIRI